MKYPLIISWRFILITTLSLALVGAILFVFRSPKNSETAWSPSVLVSDPIEKIMGGGSCTDQHFMNVVSAVTGSEVRRRNHPSGFKLYRTINPEKWTMLEFLQYNYDNRAICGAGGIYPAAADEQFLYWAGACSTGVGASGEEECDREKSEVVKNLQKELLPPVGFYWERGYGVPDETQSQEGLDMYIFHTKHDTTEFYKKISHVLMVNPMSRFSLLLRYTLPAEKEVSVSLVDGKVQYADASTINIVRTLDGKMHANPTTKIVVGSEPGYVTWGVEIRNAKGELIKTINPNDYGKQWRTLDPIAFTRDGKQLVLQAWGPRGGDVSDGMVLILQSVDDAKSETILRNPDSLLITSETKAFTAFQIHGVRTAGDTLFFNATTFENSNPLKTRLYGFDLSTKKPFEIYNSLPGWVNPFWDINGKFGGYFDEQHKAVVISRDGKQMYSQTVDAECSEILGIDSTGTYLSVRCGYSSPITYIYRMNDGKRWKLFHDPSGDNQGTAVTASFMFFST